MSANATSRESLSVVPRACQVTLRIIFILGALVLLWIYWLMPSMFTRLEGQPNRLKVFLVDEAGAPITHGSVTFSLSQEVPVIPIPFGPTRWVNKDKTVSTDSKGVAEVTWPNMKLIAQGVIMAGVSNPIAPLYTLSGSVVARTPDGKSTWDVGTNYTARIIVDRSKHVATVTPE